MATRLPTLKAIMAENEGDINAARVAYIRAAVEVGTPDALLDAFAGVSRSMGRTAEAALCESLAAYLRGTAATARRSRKATKRQPAKA